MELMEVIRRRRSARSFKPDPFPDEVLHDMLEAAHLAPSPGNCQSWYFGVVSDPQIRRQLAEAAGSQMWIATAPVICSSVISQYRQTWQFLRLMTLAKGSTSFLPEISR